MTYAKTKNKREPNFHGYEKDLDRDDWLQWRRKGLGGSDSAVALGIHPYKSPLDLYIDKIKGIDKPVENSAVEWGHKLETLVVAKIQELHPEECRVLETLPLMSHPDHSFLLATVDSGTRGKDGPGIIEAKTALSFHGGSLWKDNKIPAHYRAQCLHYLLVTGRSFAILGGLTEGARFYTHIIRPDEEELEDLRVRLCQLWDDLNNHRILKLLDSTIRTSQALNEIYTEDVGDLEPLDLRGNEKINKAIAQYHVSKGFEKAAKIDKTEAENIIKATLGNYETAYCDGALVKYSRNARGRRFSIKGV